MIGTNRRYLLQCAGLLVLFLAGRLLFLTQLPPFIDEGLHSYYIEAMEGGIISAGAGDGKWLSIVILFGLTRLPAEVLLLLRLASVIAGAATLLAILLIGRELFNARVGLFAAVFYLFTPYALIYNRLGLTDGIVVALGAWTLLVAIKAVHSSNGRYAVLLTALLLASILAKASAIIFIIFPLLALLMLVPPRRWRAALPMILPAILGTIFIVILMMSQGVGTAEIAHKTLDSTQGGFLALIAGNLALTANWFWMLLTPPLAILAGLMIISFTSRGLNRKVALLLIILAVALMPYIAGASILYPRYLLFALVPLSVLLGRFWHGLTESAHKLMPSNRQLPLSASLLLAALLLWPALYGLHFAASPEQTPLPTIVRRQYITAWTSGYGTEELTRFLEEQGRATPGGLLVLRPYYLSQVNHGGLELLLRDDDSLLLKTIGLDLDQDLQATRSSLAQGQRTVFVFDSTHQQSQQLSTIIRQATTANQIWSFAKPDGLGGLEVWELSAANRPASHLMFN